MIFFTVYLLLTILMIINKVYCLANHSLEYEIKKDVVNSNKIAKMFPNMKSSINEHYTFMLVNFYGGALTTIFVFLIELLWFFVGLFSFMWPLYLGLFVINYSLNNLDEKIVSKSWIFLLQKLFYLTLYSGFLFYFLNHYYHFVTLPL
jgi:hypothetical protein